MAQATWKLVAILIFFTDIAIAKMAFAADVQVLMQHNDPQRTGANLAETTLTPAKVASQDFALLGSYAVTGQVLAQPLYVSGVNIPGRGLRNVLVVATAANMVYAFDADSPNSNHLWSYNAGRPVRDARIYGSEKEAAISPDIGIIGTPVIDIAHSTIYFVDMTEPNLFHSLHAVDIRDGSRRGKVRITGHIEGGGTFNPAKQNQRAALALVKDRIYIAWASFNDIDPYDGLVMSYGIVDSPQPLKKLSQFQVARSNPILGKRNKRGGIWHSGGGPAIDEHGEFLYVVTGNGESCNDHAGVDFDSSDVKLDLKLRVVDYFTPSFQNFLNGCDGEPRDLHLSVSGDLPLNFHPAAVRASAVDAPCGAV